MNHHPDNDLPEFEDDCYALGHDDEIIFEDEHGYDWHCRRCGAEGWEDFDDD